MANDGFSKALHNFTMDAACGDAIRHMTDKGYTPSQIKDALTFPAPLTHISSVMLDHLIATKKILLDDPDTLTDTDIYETVERRDEYGRRSFLKVKKESPEETVFSPEDYIFFDHKCDRLSYLPLPARPVWIHRSLLDDAKEK